MTFTFNGRIYESDKQQIVAIGHNHETGEALKALEPMFVIIETDGKFQLKQTLFGGRRQHIKSFKSLEMAIKFANKLN